MHLVIECLPKVTKLYNLLLFNIFYIEIAGQSVLVHGFKGNFQFHFNYKSHA